MNGIPTSGTISWSMLRSHLQNTGTAPFGLSGAGRPTWSSSAAPYQGETPQYVPKNRSSYTFPDDAAPYAISEWRGYTHSQSGTCSVTSFTTRDIAKDYTYYKIKLTGDFGFTSSISVQANSAPNTTAVTYVFTAYPFSNTGALTTSSPALIYNLTSAQTVQQILTMSSTEAMLHIVSWQITI